MLAVSAMNKITYAFWITPIALGICAGLFGLVVSGGALYGSAAMTLTVTIASYLGVIIGIPIYLIFKKLNWINITSLIALGVLCSILVNIYPAYLGYQIDTARGEEVTVISTILHTLRFAIPVGALAGLFLWYFGFRKNAED